jgi:Na+(H+)/acetate symporter ActP
VLLLLVLLWMLWHVVLGGLRAVSYSDQSSQRQ